MRLNIKGINKAEILLRLYNSSFPQGAGFFQIKKIEDMKIEEARKMLQKKLCFDYVLGRPLKVNLEGDELETFFYDRDNGANAALRVLQDLLP